MDALDRASVSKVEERQKRALEIGNELLQHPPSSKEELLEKLDAMSLFSNTKESNFPKTSKEQRERKTSPSQKEALSSVSITKKNNFPEISKVQLKRKNSLSQEEKSADKVVREHGVDLVGCRVRVWSSRDKVQFFEQALNIVDDVPVLTPGIDSKKIVHSKAKLYRDHAAKQSEQG